MWQSKSKTKGQARQGKEADKETVLVAADKAGNRMQVVHPPLLHGSQSTPGDSEKAANRMHARSLSSVTAPRIWCWSCVEFLCRYHPGPELPFSCPPTGSLPLCLALSRLGYRVLLVVIVGERN